MARKINEERLRRTLMELSSDKEEYHRALRHYNLRPKKLTEFQHGGFVGGITSGVASGLVTKAILASFQEGGTVEDEDEEYARFSVKGANSKNKAIIVGAKMRMKERLLAESRERGEKVPLGMFSNLRVSEQDKRWYEQYGKKELEHQEKLDKIHREIAAVKFLRDPRRYQLEESKKYLKYQDPSGASPSLATQAKIVDDVRLGKSEFAKKPGGFMTGKIESKDIHYYTVQSNAKKKVKELQEKLKNLSKAHDGGSLSHIPEKRGVPIMVHGGETILTKKVSDKIPEKPPIPKHVQKEIIRLNQKLVNVAAKTGGNVMARPKSWERYQAIQKKKLEKAISEYKEVSPRQKQYLNIRSGPTGAKLDKAKLQFYKESFEEQKKREVPVIAKNLILKQERPTYSLNVEPYRRLNSVQFLDKLSRNIEDPNKKAELSELKNRFALGKPTFADKRYLSKIRDDKKVRRFLGLEFKKGGKVLTNKRVTGKGRGHWEKRLDHSKAATKGKMRKWRRHAHK